MEIMISQWIALIPGVAEFQEQSPKSGLWQDSQLTVAGWEQLRRQWATDL